MEKHFFVCDRCGKEVANQSKVYTIIRKYQQDHYDYNGMGGCEYESTSNEEDKHHLCVDCYNKVKNIIFNN